MRFELAAIFWVITLFTCRFPVVARCHIDVSANSLLLAQVAILNCRRCFKLLTRIAKLCNAFIPANLGCNAGFEGSANVSELFDAFLAYLWLASVQVVLRKAIKEEADNL